MQLTEEVHELVIFRRLNSAVFLGGAVLNAFAAMNPKLLNLKTRSYDDGPRFYAMRPLVQWASWI